MDELKAEAKDPHFVKCFSCAGNAFMVNADFGGIKPSMFIRGNNETIRDEFKDIHYGFRLGDRRRGHGRDCPCN